jgi:serine/threonine-protein kinase
MECVACHTPNVDGARFCAKCGAPLPVQRAADEDPLIGKTVGGRYRITAVLGEGGMGRVYTGEQQMGTKVRKVAVKTLLAQFAKDPQTVGRFMREAGNVSELHHPNTIQVYDFGQIEGSNELYIAMEFLEGKSLDEVLAAGQPLPPERVERIVGQVSGSLQEAHEKGIVHRDLKPANIFLTTRQIEGDSVVKVLDFGIAKQSGTPDKAEQKLTQQGTILGTPPYMSPEQFTGKELDARSDIYSLGVVVYEMLTGRLPFEADTPWQWMTQHMSAQPFPFETTPIGANVPHKMRAAVMRALEKDKANRPQSAREFFEEFSTGGARMSMLGLGAGGVGAIPTHAGISAPGTAVLSAPGAPSAGSASGRAGGTQVGEPLFPEGGPPGGAAAKTMTGEAMPYGSPAVPTAGGQVYPAPPPPAPRKSGGGGGLAVIGIVAFLLIGGGVGGFFMWKRSAADGEDTPTVALGEKKSSKSKGDDGETAETDETKGASSTATARPTETASASPTTSATAEPTTTASSKPTAEPTTTTSPSGTGTTKQPQPGIDACCAAIPARDRTKRTLCNRINAKIKTGEVNRQAAMGTLRSQGIVCN